MILGLKMLIFMIKSPLPHTEQVNTPRTCRSNGLSSVEPGGRWKIALFISVFLVVVVVVDDVVVVVAVAVVVVFLLRPDGL